jgi:hypothetical protein
MAVIGAENSTFHKGNEEEIPLGGLAARFIV